MLPFLMPSMLGAGGLVVNMPATVSAGRVVAAPATATATVNFNRDGTITNHAGTSLGTWIDPRSSTIGDGYELKYDRNSGSTLSSGASADGAWIALSSNRAYTNNATSGIRSTSLTWSIREAGGATVLDTATGTIEAESS